MKTLLSLAFLASGALSAHAEQVIECTAQSGRRATAVYEFKAVLDPNAASGKNKYGLEMTLSEPEGRDFRAHKNVKLETLYATFGAGSTSDVPFERAERVNFAGFLDGKGLSYDAYHIDFPIQYWNKNVAKFEAKGWFQDTEVGAGDVFTFDCSSRLK